MPTLLHNTVSFPPPAPPPHPLIKISSLCESHPGPSVRIINKRVGTGEEKKEKFYSNKFLSLEVQQGQFHFPSSNDFISMLKGKE